VKITIVSSLSADYGRLFGGWRGQNDDCDNVADIYDAKVNVSPADGVWLSAMSAGNSDVAHQRMEDIILLAITSLASLTYLPLAPLEPKNNFKSKVAESFGNVLCQPSLANVSADYLLLLRHPGTCATVLKVFWVVNVYVKPLSGVG